MIFSGSSKSTHTAPSEFQINFNRFMFSLFKFSYLFSLSKLKLD